MDIDLLKTFLEVHRTRHFGRAAENLFLTPSAVSARIRLLEETLGAQLFTRTRNNIRLSPAGERFLRHAGSILSAWHRARQDTALAEQDRVALAIGGMDSLWDVLLQDWVHELHRRMPKVALEAEAHGWEGLVRKLLDGVLDVAFLFEPPQVPEVLVREVAHVRLCMVATRPALRAEEAVREGYVMVDWGRSFAITHARHFPGIPAPVARMGLGRMALAFVIDCGGAAYLPEPMVQAHLADGRLHRVHDAPLIDRQAYAAYPGCSERRALVEEALGLLPTAHCEVG
jgi:LysR family transcriptional regulator, flagellar master operon regulator